MIRIPTGNTCFYIYGIMLLNGQPQYIVVGAQNGKAQKCSSPSNLCEFKVKHHYPILEFGLSQIFQEYEGKYNYELNVMS